MPLDYVKKLRELLSHNETYENCFTFLLDMLEEVRDENLATLTFGLGIDISKIEQKKSPGSGSVGGSKVNNLVFNGHDCKKSLECKNDWDFLGCIKLYKLSKVEERRDFLRERKACWHCGSR